MKRERLWNVRILLAISIVASFAASMWFSYLAGCAGDLKGGALGDPQRALEIESNAALLGWLSVLLAAGLFGSLPRLHISQRFGAAILSICVGLIAITLLGIEFEGNGVRACLL
ncbi:hypothetical protein [Chitinimonas sp.]|uniref:hypothetical protein n=1 Tax=Chitinimonas sp. TaxID=1934313 RepID=UPI0035ADDA09